MEELSGIVSMIADVGGTVIVTLMLWVVWKRLTELTDHFIDILAELRLQSLTDHKRDNKPSNQP
jgi:hypothetical protein